MFRLSPALLPRLRWLALLALMVLIPGLFIGGAQPVAVDLIPAPWDKLAHALSFAMFAALLALSWGLLPLRLAVQLRLGWLSALVMGAADELHQLQLPGRHGNWQDLGADAIGATLGVALLYWLIWREQEHRHLSNR